jgi:hypothetical protein
MERDGDPCGNEVSLSKLGDLLRGGLRSAERMFHMLVGVVFLFLALAGASVAFQEWQSYQRSPSVGLVRFGLLAGFTALLFVFCLYSFLKARSVR